MEKKKELSTEEKAKRYDKAIGEIRGMMPNWERLSYNGKTFLQDLIHILPELKKNEYESTRERIIALVNAHGQGRFKESMLAWLEKQGEQKATWSEEDEESLNQLHNLIVKKAYEEYEIDSETKTLYGKYATLNNWLKSLKDRMKGE